MKILKHGKPQGITRTFSCQSCGCEFEAEKEEYNKVLHGSALGMQIVSYNCKCPECEEIARENKEKEN